MPGKLKPEGRAEIAKTHSGTGVARPRVRRVSGGKTAGPKSRQRSPRAIRKLFDALQTRWRNDVEFVSNYATIITHPSYYQIIGLGEAALPFIFGDLARGGGPWFVALSAITRVDAVKPAHRNNSARMRADWLEWGKTHGYCA